MTAAAAAPPEEAAEEKEGAVAVVAEVADEAATGKEEVDPAGKMNSMLKAASVEVAGGDGDDDWE